MFSVSVFFISILNFFTILHPFSNLILNKAGNSALVIRSVFKTEGTGVMRQREGLPTVLKEA